MANLFYAFLREAQLPDQQALQEAIFEAGFDLELDPMYNVRKTAGHVSCMLSGQLTGCDIAFSDAANAKERAANVDSVPQTHDVFLSLEWGEDDLLGSIAVMILAATLSLRFDALVSHNGNAPMPAAELVQGAELMLSALDD